MVFCPRWDKHNKIYKGWEKHQKEELDVEKVIEDWAKPTRERLIVLKQMGSSGAIAISIAGIFLAFNCWGWQLANRITVFLVAFLLSLFLYWGYRWAKLALDTAEQKIHPYQGSNQDKIEES